MSICTLHTFTPADVLATLKLLSVVSLLLIDAVDYDQVVFWVLKYPPHELKYKICNHIKYFRGRGL